MQVDTNNMSGYIFHPLFKECQDYTIDQYWRDIFYTCSCNKFPKGARYDGETRTLYVKSPEKRGKSQAISIPDNAEQAYKIIIDNFRERLGMFSAHDIRIKREELEEVKKNIKINLDCEWKKLKPKWVRDHLILKYTIRLESEHNLTPKESKDLHSTVQLGFQLKKLTSDDVNYNNGKITSLNGLIFDEKNRKWKITNKSPTTSSSEKSAAKEKFIQKMDRFIRTYKKRKLKVA